MNTQPERWYGRHEDDWQSTRHGGLRVKGVTLRRGIDTSLGQAGYCVACDRDMPDGPDACLGFLPGVAHACCGHGGVAEPYVSFGDYPDQPGGNGTVLRDADALAYFEEVRNA